jgi:hypothetical protein
MTYVQAAEFVLKSARRSLDVSAIVETALAKGLIQPTGKTPKATMSAALYGLAKASPRGRIRREYLRGVSRAKRGSVRWVYVR